MKFYSMIGSDTEIIDETLNPLCPTGHIEMPSRSPGRGYVAQADGSWVFCNELLEAVKAEKRIEIHAACDAMLKESVLAYPQAEILTFSRQAAEARALLADASADVPLITALAKSRDQTVAALAKRVLAKEAAFDAAYAEGIAIKRRLEAQLDDCHRIEDIETLAFALCEDDGETAPASPLSLLGLSAMHTDNVATPPAGAVAALLKPKASDTTVSEATNRPTAFLRGMGKARTASPTPNGEV